MKVFVAKVNVNDNIFKNNVDEIISTEIPNQIKLYSNTEKELKVYDRATKDDWTLSDINGVNDNLITGYLSRCTETEIEVTRKQRRDNEKIAESISVPFAYYIKEEYIVFGTNTQIKEITFIRVFNNLLMENGGLKKIGGTEVNLLPTRESMDLFIKGLTLDVVKLEIDIIMPNTRKIFDGLSESLDETQAQKAKIKLENKKGQLELVDKNGRPLSFVQESLNMSDSGYGEAKIYISKNGVTETISTNDKVQSTIIPNDAKDDTNLFLEFIKDFVDNIRKKR